MSWCDKLASTPAVGLKLTPQFTPAEHVLANLTPILNQYVEKERATFSVEAMEPFSAQLNTEAGYLYSYDSNSFSITYNHRVRVRQTSGGPPILELISQPAPYTILLNETIDRYKAALLLFPSVQNRFIHRVGIVSTTTVDLDDAPPGLAAIFEEIARPLGGKSDHMVAAIRTLIKSTDKRVDRCMHTFTIPDDDKGLVKIQLDWQRSFIEPLAITKNSVENVFDQATKEALEYFDRAAIGGLSDAINGNQ